MHTVFLTARYLALVGIGLALCLARQGMASEPQPAHGIFLTDAYTLTFHVPPGLSYCPLPKDFTGSDHGTVLFLVKPKTCGGAGYPSSSRGFTSNPSRIEIFYAYWMGEDEPPKPPCHRIGRVRFLGVRHNLCQSRQDGMLRIGIAGRYNADVEAEAQFALVTTPRRLRQDLVTFKALLASTKTCIATIHPDTGKAYSYGHGTACPSQGKFF